jgi:mannose-6-phosphate isomerase-like protein (cupin superfamily)
MTVSRDVLTRGRAARPGEFLEKIDSGDLIAMDIREEKRFGALSFSGDIPFWRVDLSQVATPDATDAAGEPLHLAELDTQRFKLSRRAAPMSYVSRSTVADQLHFIHSGKARFQTELGDVMALPGRFIYVGRGVRYRVTEVQEPLFDLILESEPGLRPSAHWKTVDLKINRPTFPAAGSMREGPWEERINGLGWSTRVMRDYDPLIAKEVVGSHELVLAVDMHDIPADVPGTHRPFRLFANDMLELDISKQGEGEGPPFHHRNNVRNEIHFVHSGNANQQTELGYIEGSPGTMYCMPFGIEHTFAKRAVRPQTLLFESKGQVRLNEKLRG